MDLSNRNLSVIPDSVFSCIDLEYLNVGNSFTLYPPLSALGQDTMENMNHITEIPEDIGRLQHLRVLNICFNNLKTLPKEITKLKQLDTMDISFNQHLKLANEVPLLKQMHWLKYLSVAGISFDSASIKELRTSLPKTKIVASLEELLMEANQ